MNKKSLFWYFYMMVQGGMKLVVFSTCLSAHTGNTMDTNTHSAPAQFPPGNHVLYLIPAQRHHLPPVFRRGLLQHLRRRTAATALVLHHAADDHLRYALQ